MEKERGIAMWEHIWTSLIAGAVGGAISYLAARAKLRDEARIKLKVDACLDALTVVDGRFAAATWEEGGVKVTPTEQTFTIAQARRAHSSLAAVCRSPSVVKCYADALALTRPGEEERKPSTDDLEALRGAIRRELGLRRKLQLNPSHRWIVQVPGASDA